MCASRTLFGAAEVVRSNGGTLTAPAPGRDAVAIVGDFLHSNQALYGLSGAEVSALHFLGESRSPANGLRMVRFEQQVNGLPVFQSDTRFIVAADGRLVRSVGLLVPSLTAAAAPLGQPITAAAALASAMNSVGITVDARAAQVANASGDGAKAEVVAHNPAIKDAVVSQLAVLPACAGDRRSRLVAGDLYLRRWRLVHAGGCAYRHAAVAQEYSQHL